ncbi:hypothetical protein GWG65_29725 [Bradyrhizobium sp. CSA207]|uniref:hypothetical protein n=1 Tax=Bradyrhizobium sp. CSA207 TaxID=2698826 RepID=UPI0023AFC8C9|nr:hypothetical protein [Bradyrhizobium sp. CSA207]MDE5445532.1 hypothetical protein [Bradyrhizobium sp. CSA207]
MKINATVFVLIFCAITTYTSQICVALGAADIAYLGCATPQGTVELRICADPELKKFDDALRRRLNKYLTSELYQTSEIRSNLQRFRTFLDDRNKKCDLASPQEITDCIAEITLRFDNEFMDALKERLDENIHGMDERAKERAAQKEERDRTERQERAAQAAEDDRSVTFHVKNSYQYSVQVEFSSKSRDVYWPGNGRAYTLNDSQVHKYRLACVPGEKICMGAWAAGSSRPSWGVGYSNAHGCTGCCATCGARSVAGFNLEYTGHEESQQTSGLSAADLLGAAIGVAGAVAGSGGFNTRSAPSVPRGSPPRTRDSGVSGLK